MQQREFRQQARTGKIRVWRIEVRGHEIHTEYGELGSDNMQTVVDEGVAKNIGRKNEISAEQDAQNQAERMILKKTRAGYTEGSFLEQWVVEDLIDNPPQSLCFYKPANSLSAKLTKLVEDGKAWLGRKRDGEMMIIVKHITGGVSIRSRRMLDRHHLEQDTAFVWHDRFPHLASEIADREDIPNGTILLGDIVADTEEDMRWDVASVMKSLTPEALRKQERTGNMLYYCWDIAFWNGKDLLTERPVRERFELLWDVFGGEWDGSSWVIPVDVWEPHAQLGRALQPLIGDEDLPESLLECAQLFAKLNGWEGWVVVDPDGVYGDRGYNLRGKPDRPGQFCGKLKPVYEIDAVMNWDPRKKEGKEGRGNNRGKVGSVALYQYDGDGNLVYLCDCGSGIDDEFRATYTKPSDFPLVGEIAYTERTFVSEGGKTNALTYPRLVRVRHDKSPDECIEEKLNSGKKD